MIPAWWRNVVQWTRGKLPGRRGRGSLRAYRPAFESFEERVVPTSQIVPTNLNLASLSLLGQTPTAVDHTYTAIERLAPGDSGMTIASPGLLANDSDPRGLPLQANVLSNPSHGTMTWEASGSFAYVPNIGFTGSDTFAYQASDGVSSSPAATVTVIVTARLTIPSGVLAAQGNGAIVLASLATTITAMPFNTGTFALTNVHGAGAAQGVTMTFVFSGNTTLAQSSTASGMQGIAYDPSVNSPTRHIGTLAGAGTDNPAIATATAGTPQGSSILTVTLSAITTGSPAGNSQTTAPNSGPIVPAMEPTRIAVSEISTSTTLTGTVTDPYAVVATAYFGTFDSTTPVAAAEQVAYAVLEQSENCDTGHPMPIVPRSAIGTANAPVESTNKDAIAVAGADERDASKGVTASHGTANFAAARFFSMFWAYAAGVRVYKSVATKSQSLLAKVRLRKT
jgi:hypothetical protein